MSFRITAKYPTGVGVEIIFRDHVNADGRQAHTTEVVQLFVDKGNCKDESRFGDIPNRFGGAVAADRKFVQRGIGKPDKRFAGRRRRAESMTAIHASEERRGNARSTLREGAVLGIRG